MTLLIKSARLRGTVGWGLLALAALLSLGVPVAHARDEAAPAAVQADPVVKANLTQFRVQVENGKEVLKPVQTVKPGDLIEYRVTYTNRGSKPVRDLQAELPIPLGLEYQPKSARPAQAAEAAVDGGAYAREPLMREGKGGKQEPVPYSEYRRLRWTLGQIAAGAKAEVSARARVSSGVPVNSQSGAQSAVKAAAGR
ncbi:MAG: hypothetical protein ACKOXQ_10075 [Hydrogenophaga sp.]